MDAHAIKEFIKQSASFGQLQSVLLVGADSYDYRDNLGLGAFSFLPTLYTRTSALVARAPRRDRRGGGLRRADHLEPVP